MTSMKQTMQILGGSGNAKAFVQVLESGVAVVVGLCRVASEADQGVVSDLGHDGLI